MAPVDRIDAIRASSTVDPSHALVFVINLKLEAVHKVAFAHNRVASEDTACETYTGTDSMQVYSIQAQYLHSSEAPGKM